MFGCIVTIVNQRLRTDPDIDGNKLKKSILKHDMDHWVREMFLDFSIVIGDALKAKDKLEEATKMQNKAQSHG